MSGLMSVLNVDKSLTEILTLQSTSGTLHYATSLKIPMERRESTLVEMEALANMMKVVFVKLPSVKQENQSIARSYARKKLRRSHLSRCD